jgi:hypothetical protein
MVGLGRNIGSHVALYLYGDDERVSRAALIAAQFIQSLKEGARDLAELAALTSLSSFQPKVGPAPRQNGSAPWLVFRLSLLKNPTDLSRAN